MPTIPPVEAGLTVHSIGNPGAGNQLTTSVPANLTYRILGLSFLFTTDANAASREVVILWKQSSAVLGFAPTGINQPENEAWSYSFWNAYPAVVQSNGDDIAAPLPGKLILTAGDTLNTLITNIQVGDAITAVTLTVQSWINP